MTSRNVETRVVRLEARSRIGRMSRYGKHAAVASALAAIDPVADQRLNALHQAGELQP